MCHSWVSKSTVGLSGTAECRKVPLDCVSQLEVEKYHWIVCHSWVSKSTVGLSGTAECRKVPLDCVSQLGVEKLPFYIFF